MDVKQHVYLFRLSSEGFEEFEPLLYMWAQSQGHHTIDRLEEGGVELGSAPRSILKGREGVVVSHLKKKKVNCFQGNDGKTSERRRGAHMGFSERIYLL